jgi:N-acetylneuraminate synthase
MDLWAALGDGVKRIEGNEAETARIQKRSLYYIHNKQSGSILVKEDVHPLRPMNPAGISPHNLENILGKKLKKQVDKDTCIKWEDFE